MNPEEIKIGETYNVRVKVDARSVSGNFICASVTPYGRALEAYVFLSHEAEAFSPIIPVNGIKYAEPAPKYDPCRKFREGDFVKPEARFGRNPDDDAPCNVICKVEEDEQEDGTVLISHTTESALKAYRVTALYLKLVQPVEELEPYFVAYDDKFYHVHKKGEDAALAVYYEAKHPNAKAAAEAECQRLNEEWRKAQK